MNYLQKFQQENGLVADGIVGLKTITKFMGTFKAPSIIATCHFLGQIYVESGGFTAGREDISEHSANTKYANRYGNQMPQSGDGYKYRGGGGIQTTFKANYEAYFKHAGLPLDSDPDLLCEDKHWWGSAKFYFDNNRVWDYCNIPSVQCIMFCSKKINCGNASSSRTPNGIDERKKKTLEYFKACGYDGSF